MASAFGRKAQRVIDRVRGKERVIDLAAQYEKKMRDVRREVQPVGELEQIFYAHNGRIANKWYHYLAVYDEHFSRVRARTNGTARILELGVSDGGSLQLWRQYFGARAAIVGIDINPACAARVDPGSHVVIGDQTDPATLELALEKLGGVDIVIDDGSHLGKHQIASFEYLYPRLSANGLYVCEDLLCSYWPTHEGGLLRAGTFVEHTKQLIDRLHAWFLEDPLKSEALPFAQSTYAIHLYTNVVVFEKRPVTEPWSVQMGRRERSQ